MTTRIKVSAGGRDRYAIVDDETADEFTRRRWCLKDGYAACRPTGDESASMHRQICGLLRGDPRAVHHLNENKLDNRRENLEICESMSAANCRPHPKRDAATRAGYEAYLARMSQKAAA